MCCVWVCFWVCFYVMFSGVQEEASEALAGAWEQAVRWWLSPSWWGLSPGWCLLGWGWLLLFDCFIASLFALLFHCVMVSLSLFHCLFHCLFNCFIVLLIYCFIVSLLHCFLKLSLFHCLLCDCCEQVLRQADLQFLGLLQQSMCTVSLINYACVFVEVVVWTNNYECWVVDSLHCLSVCLLIPCQLYAVLGPGWARSLQLVLASWQALGNLGACFS